jgi:hypothetical protein
LRYIRSQIQTLNKTIHNHTSARHTAGASDAHKNKRRVKAGQADGALSVVGASDRREKKPHNRLIAADNGGSDGSNLRTGLMADGSGGSGSGGREPRVGTFECEVVQLQKHVRTVEAVLCTLDGTDAGEVAKLQRHVRMVEAVLCTLDGTDAGGSSSSSDASESKVNTWGDDGDEEGVGVGGGVGGGVGAEVWDQLADPTLLERQLLYLA